eukprot:gene971-1236_t
MEEIKLDDLSTNEASPHLERSPSTVGSGSGTGISFRSTLQRGLSHSVFLNNSKKSTPVVRDIDSLFVTARNLCSSVGTKKKKNEKNILSDLNFFLKPGSMVLMLGSPGCGKTSLMKALSLMTTNEKISGKLLFNGKIGDPNTHHRHVSYVVQDDHHMAPFTVRETFKFSADMQMKEGCADDEKEERVNQILQFLDLTRQADTVVGDEFLRDKVEKENISCLVSLLQPGIEITKLFDYLMILSKGEMAYFGPMDQAIDYFEDFGFKLPSHHNPAELFQEIVDEPELYFPEDSQPPLRGTEEFARAYRESRIHRQIVEYIDNNIPDPINYTDWSQLHTYPTSIGYQILMTSKRGLKMVLSNLITIRMRLIKAIVMGLILGSLYWNLSNDQSDGNNRSGLIFFSLLYVVFGGFGTIGVYFSQRDVFQLQRNWKYYNTFSFFFSMIISEIPLTLVESVVFSTLVYWMCGLQSNPEKFIYFLVLNFVATIMAQALFRMVSSFTSTSTIASALAPAILSPFILLSGFMVKKPAIPGWWIWVYWISPIHYSFEGLMSNEHHGMKYTCAPEEYIPPPFIPNFNMSYPEGFEGHQTCPITNGDQFLEQLGFAQNNWFKWIDLVIVGGFTLVFFVITYVCMLKLIFVQHRKEKDEKVKKTKKKVPNKNDAHISIKEQEAKIKKEIPIGCYMQWKNLIYEVTIKKDGKKQRLRLLNEINGYVKPGMLLALMGPSGAGKSTLLDVLANRKTGGHTYGEILINGAPRTRYFTRTSAYVEQLDVLPPTQTVREAIQFSAKTRLPEDMPMEEKLAFVENILETLNLLKIGNQQIGHGEQGLTLSQRKRLICDPYKNPADFILDVTNEDIQVPQEDGSMGAFSPVESYKESPQNTELMEKISNGIMPAGTPVATFKGKYASSIFTQFNVLFTRSWLAQIRRFQNIRTRIGRSLGLGIALGTIYLRMENEQADVYNRIALLFFSLMFGGMAGMGTIPVITIERGVFYREQASGMYRVWIYLAAFIITDLPWLLLASLAYVIPMYFLAGLHIGSGGEAFLYHNLLSYSSYINFMLMCLVLAIVFPTDELAFAFSGVCLSLTSLFAGFMIPPPSMPKGWKWFYHLDFLNYPLQSYLITEFKDIDFECTHNKDAVPVVIPDKGVKYFCPTTHGTQVLDRLEIDIGDQYTNFAIICGYSVFFIIVAYLTLRFIRHQTK